MLSLRSNFLSNPNMRTKLSQFSFELPEKLIAKYPSKERDESKLMVINRKTGLMENKMFKDILDYFGEGDCMIFNNTKVFPARLYGRKEKTDAEIEVFLLRELNSRARLWVERAASRELPAALVGPAPSISSSCGSRRP